MVKQFTIPCTFGAQTAPVTFYIGHPEITHHPIDFQAKWLSSTKRGQVPQDLMDTLKKLHDLAMENNADFEELCFYALINASNNSSGGGGSNPEDIQRYAKEFVDKDGKVEIVKSNNTETEQKEIKMITQDEAKKFDDSDLLEDESEDSEDSSSTSDSTNLDDDSELLTSSETVKEVIDSIDDDSDLLDQNEEKTESSDNDDDSDLLG